MTSGFTSFPDTLAVCIHAAIDAGVCSGRVYSSIPTSPVFPIVVMQRLGGVSPVRQRLDGARISIDCWGGNLSEAWAAADAARLALMGLEGTTDSARSAFITGVDDESGPLYLPDPDSGRDRYQFSLIVYAHAA